MPSPHETYSDIELTTEVMNASGHRLIQMLMEKCASHIGLAKIFIDSQDVVKKHQAISKALDIINYLRSCLNFKDESTVELSTLLDSVYEFLDRALLRANLNNDIKMLEQAEKALQLIKSGWDDINIQENINDKV